MLIISQDKRSIINFDQVVKVINISQSDLREIRAYFNCDELKSDDNIILGRYETEERAREILSEIIIEYKKVARVDEQGANKPRFYSIPKVYYMPEK